MKKKLCLKLIFSCLIIMLMCTLTGCSKLLVEREYIYNDSKYSIGNKAFGEITINEINIDWIAGNIYIQESSNHEIIIREDVDTDIDDKYKMHYYLEDDVLDIKYAASNLYLNYTFKTKDLYVYLPQRINIIEINNVSANIDISSVSITKLEIDNVSGDININSSSITKLEIENVSGEVIAMGINNTYCSIESTSGNIGLSFNVLPKSIKVNTASASSTIYIKDYECLVFKFSSVSGRFTSAFEYNEVSGYNVIDYYHLKEDSCYLEMSTVSGNLKIKKK